MTDLERVAIVGLGGIFPQSPTLEQFWNNILRCTDTSREVPPGRWLLAADDAYDPAVAVPDKVYSKRGCFIEDFELDSEGLEVDRELLAQLDPMFHFLLHAGRQAWRDAATGNVDRSRVGVIIGNIVLPTEKASALSREFLSDAYSAGWRGPSMDVKDREGCSSLPGLSRRCCERATHPLNRFVAGLPAGVLAKALGLGGGCFTLDAACASSLYAMKLATAELLAGRADAMLTGGLSRPDCLYTQMGFSQLRALSPSGRASPFDARADGLVVGEGCGIFVLKRLEDALRDGDHIYATVAGIGLSNDIEGNLLAPSSEGQLRAMREAYRQAGWQPEDVDVIECHATGTPVGDAVEFASLRQLWQDRPARAGQCVIGSVKSNIGHALTAAGSAGLLKVLLALRNNTLPPSANFSNPNPQIAYRDGPFQILNLAMPWLRRSAGEPRRAAVSGFGFGGINAHVLLEEWRPERKLARDHTERRGPTAQKEPNRIAIIGTAAHFGPWQTLDDFQQRVLGNEERHEPQAPTNWWGVDGGEYPGYYLSEISFPCNRFRIPPKELEEMLPQQLLMLHVAAEAVADARLSDELGARTGVFIGIGLDLNTTNFSFRWSLLNDARRWSQEQQLDWPNQALAGWALALRDAAGPPLTPNRTMGALGGIVASRIARAFRVGGPSFTVSSEETSGLSAMRVAAGMLQRGEIDRAIVGAVDLAGDPRLVMPAEDVMPVEGATTIILKRLDDAERDGDRIYAVITSVAHVSNLPDVSKARQDRSVPNKWKAGYSGAATGLAALVTSAIGLHQEVQCAPRPQYWLRNRAEGPRTADVACDGVDGSRVLVRLQESERRPAVDSMHAEPLAPTTEALFVAQGDNIAEVREALARLVKLAATPMSAVDILARRWLDECRTDGQQRLAVALVARHGGELREQLAVADRHLTDKPHARLAAADRVFYGPAPLGRTGKLAFVFPGSGNHFAGMGRDLSARWPSVLRRQDAENEYLRDQILPDVFWSDELIPAKPDHRTLIQGQVALSALVSDLLVGFGIQPHAALGYSLGESAALFALRAWTDRDEMLRRLQASSLFTADLAGACLAARQAWKAADREEISWRAGLVNCPGEAVRRALKNQRRAYLLIINTPQECVIGGDQHAVEAAVRELGCQFLPLAGVSTVHCEIAKAVANRYRELHLLKTTPPEGIAFYSGAWGRAYAVTRESAAEAILAQAVQTLDIPTLFEQAYADGVRLFVEVGPGNSCSRIIGQILGDRPHLARSACVAGQDATSLILRLLANLVAEGVLVDWQRLYRGVRERMNETDETKGAKALVVKVRDAAFRPPPWPEHVAGAEPSRPTRSRSWAMSLEEAAHPTVSPLVTQWSAAETAKAEAHRAYLQFAEGIRETMERRVGLQMTLAVGSAGKSPIAVAREATFASQPTPVPSVFLDRDHCLEFAVGSIAKVLGSDFAPVDSYPTRVRLPDEPLMLVDRIMSIEGEPRTLGSGRVVTEHDIHPGAWYLDGGRIPTCIAVEAGQADLFLSGYLGIDFVTQGRAVYRLLDAVVTFHGSLPEPGAIIQYDICIERFFRQDATHLFRFRFEGSVNGKPLLSMRDGCAGFFTATELAAGKGIVQTEMDRRPRPGVRPVDWEDFVSMAVETYSDLQIDALRAGDLARCFGPSFADLPLADPVRLPGGKMHLIDRVTQLDPGGGRYGMGVIRAEADIHRGDWFLTCHFVDDQVMPGTLMYECCMHTLRVLLMRMGWVGERAAVVYEPVPGVASRLKCRGQVIASTNKVTYEVTIKELGYRPEPYVLADALMYADGKPIVEITNMSLRMTGLDREKLQETWQRARSHQSAGSAAGESDDQSGAASLGKSDRKRSRLTPRAGRPVLYDHDRILAFAIGKPSEAFGEPYRVFDEERVIARLPGPPYQFLDRIVAIEAEPWKMAAGGVIQAEYDVPPDAWYFAANRQREMPFAVLLEIALQPCGWLAAYLGSALTSETDLSFRNLGGQAMLHAPVTRDIGTLTTTVKITKVSSSGGMIIQNYDFTVRKGERLVYQGDTYFGFFTKAALAQQVGIREARPYLPTDEERARGKTIAYPAGAPFPERQLRMIDDLDLFVPDGGPHKLGFIQGQKRVDPKEWFFNAHFFQDPVCPGSLGLESFLQLLKVVAYERWGHEEFGMPLAKSHRWLYRGQVVPHNQLVTVQAVVTALDDAQRMVQADGSLSVDGRVIYQMNDFAIRLTSTR